MDVDSVAKVRRSGKAKLQRRECAHGTPRDKELYKHRAEINLERLESNVSDVTKQKEVAAQSFWQGLSAYVPTAGQGLEPRWQDKNKQLLQTTRFFKHDSESKGCCFVWWVCTQCGISVKFNEYKIDEYKLLKRHTVALSEYFHFKPLNKHSGPQCTPHQCEQAGRHAQSSEHMAFKPKTYAAIREKKTQDPNYPAAWSVAGATLITSLNGRYPGVVEDGIDVEKKKTIEWFHKTGKGSPDREVYAFCRKCQHGVTFTGLVSDQEAVRKKGSKSLHTWLLVSREHKSVRTKCVRWETRTDSEPDTLGSSMNTSTLGSSTNSEKTSAVPASTPTGTPTGGSTGGSMGSMTSSNNELGL